MKPDSVPAAPPVPPTCLRRAAAWCLAAFVVLSLLFGSMWRAGVTADAGLTAMRAGTLADLVSELPRGRQALVACPWLLPVPTLMALPFVLLLPARAYGLAYLYALAAAGALAVLPLGRLLARAGLRHAFAAAFAMAVGFCAWAVGTVWADTVPALACLAAAVALECSRRAAGRALAGALYGAAALAHPFGFAVAWLRVLAGGVAAVLRPRSAERLAVGFVQCTQIAYAAGIYLFLNAMIMGRPAYAFTHAFGRPTRPATEAVRELDRALRRRYEGFAPVVSGPWGYLAQDILARRSGYHVVDFHPDKVPAWEQRDVLLIVPAPGNPVLPWHDTPAVRGDGQAGFPGRVLLLERTERWLFYLVSPAAQASD